MSIWFCQLDSPNSLVELVGLVPVFRVGNALNFQNGALKKKLVGDTHSKTFGPNPNYIRPFLNLLFPPTNTLKLNNFKSMTFMKLPKPYVLCYKLIEKQFG